ncbi:unnamed protein product [Lymnaea stagnalis]|uniref:Uncharacterized protein n=1 Tax=Lymnaea stagnalis TaxID=6523 RepID=A0AAV2H5I2_LYMST
MDKTSLAFQAAVSAAAAGAKVAYICTHPFKRLPAQIHGMRVPESAIMNNVDFLYLEETRELLAWFASIHTKSNLPSYIVIEDLLTYATQMNDTNVEKSLAKICATIADAVAWISSHNEVKRCQVLMTAPTRITSLYPILSKFHYRTASYQGPGEDAPFSQLHYESDDASITVKFHRQNDCLMMTDVSASKQLPVYS